MGIEQKELDKLLEWFHKSDLASAEIEYNKDGSYKVIMSKGQMLAPSASFAQLASQLAPQVVQGAAQGSASANIETGTENGIETSADADTSKVTAPIVGTFYRASNPDTPPFAQVGDVVKKGEVLCILEAMKVMNEFEAEFDMEIISILVDNASLVEFDQPLFEVKAI